MRITRRQLRRLISESIFNSENYPILRSYANKDQHPKEYQNPGEQAVQMVSDIAIFKTYVRRMEDRINELWYESGIPDRMTIRGRYDDSTFLKPANWPDDIRVPGNWIFHRPGERLPFSPNNYVAGYPASSDPKVRLFYDMAKDLAGKYSLSFFYDDRAFLDGNKIPNPDIGAAKTIREMEAIRQDLLAKSKVKERGHSEFSSSPAPVDPRDPIDDSPTTVIRYYTKPKK